MKSIPVSYPDVGDEELEAISRVFKSGYLGMGNETRSFESEIIQYLGAQDREAICVNSGTAALHLACEALNLDEGDQVLIPSLTFVACFQAVSAAGATPVACDVTTNGLICLDDAAKKMTAKTKAIMFVYFGGQASNLDEVYRFAEKHQLRVIEDAAHAFGSRINDKPVGAFGDITCFSFDPIKSVTSGEGGAVVTNDPEVLENCRQMRVLGIRANSDWQGQGLLGRDFDVAIQGYRYHMSDIMACIGRVQLKKFKNEGRQKRIGLMSYYCDQLTGIPKVTLLDQTAEIVSYCLPIRVPSKKRNRLREKLAEKGFTTAVHYKPSHLLNKFSSNQSLPTAELLYSELLSLPFHLSLKTSDVDLISEVIADELSI